MRLTLERKENNIRCQSSRRRGRRVHLYLFFVLVCLAFTGCGNREITVPVYDEEPEAVDEISAFVIVSNIDEVNGKISLKAVSYDTELTLSYNGGTDVQDKYGDVLSMSRVEPGTVADIVYDGNRDKLISLHISNNEKVQKVEHISGAKVDVLENTITWGGNTYRMSDTVTAFSDNTEIYLSEICSEDQISIWLYNDIVCSLYVELGHGYLRLTDYAGYIGGMVEVGYDVIVPVTEDMLLTVREGEYTLRIAKGDDVGNKKVEIVRNQETVLSLADIAIEPKQMGSVMFQVTPSNAAVYIDGRRVNTEGAVELTYGKHSILIQADGYESYSADFNVKYAYKVKEYKLTPADGTTESSTTSKTSTSTQTSGSTAQNTSGETATTEKTTEATTESGDSTVNKQTANKLIITAPSGASVYFDGEYVGIAPISFTKVTGSHIITLSQTGYLSKSYTITLTDDGKDTTLTYDPLTSISSLMN